MTELRDRIAAVVYDALPDGFGHRWRTSVSGSIANRLIAAGVTMPEPTCGATAVIDGCEYVCDQLPHRDTQWTHMCTDSVGTTCWWDGPTGPVVGADGCGEVSLSDEQRHLIAAYDSGLIAGVILHPGRGLAAIKDAQAHGPVSRINGPEWLTGWSTTITGIHGLDPSGAVRITVTYDELMQWANGIPPAAREKVAAIHTEIEAERARVEGWCRCGGQRPCAGYHPTLREENRRGARDLALSTAQSLYVGRAIWAKGGAVKPIPSGKV